jgi:hypothetical protein
METNSKIIKGREIQEFDICQGSLYILRNTDVVVMASQVNKINSDDFSGMIVSGALNGWPIGHYSVFWDKKEFKVFEGTIELEQIN